MLTEEQKLARRNGIGGSDVAAIFGLSEYRTAVDVYLEKHGLAEPRPMTDSQRHGHIMEPVILGEYVEHTGIPIIRSPDTFISAKYPWMLGNFDAIDFNNRIIVDAKYMSRFSRDKWGEPGTNQMPDDILLQMIHYAIVADADYVDVAVFFDRPDLFLYRYERNPEFEKRVIEQEQLFWHNNVLAQVPPPAKSIDDARALWKEARKESVRIASDEIIVCWSKLREADKKIKELEDQKEKMKATIMIDMQECEKLTDQSGFVLATWKNQKSKTRVFRHYKGDTR